MKHDDLVALVKDSGDYITDLRLGHDDNFLGFVYVKNYKYDSYELQNQFAIPIQSEEQKC